MASETRAPSTVSGPAVTTRRSLKHPARRSPFAALVAILISVVVARLVLLYVPANSPGKATATRSQSLRFPQARPPAFSARLHYQHGAVQHVFAARPPHPEQDLQPLWEPGKPIADIEIPPAGRLTFRRRDGSSGRLTAANASSFCLTDPHACTDWSRVRLEVSLEAALRHLHESGASPRVRQKEKGESMIRQFWLTARLFPYDRPRLGNLCLLARPTR